MGKFTPVLAYGPSSLTNILLVDSRLSLDGCVPNVVSRCKNVVWRFSADFYFTATRFFQVETSSQCRVRCRCRDLQERDE